MMAENKNKQQPFYRRTWVLGRRRRPIIPSGPTTLILDQFNGTDGTLLPAHAIAPTNTPGNSWVAEVNNFKLSSNSAVVSSSANSVCHVDAGVSDCTVSAVMNAGTSNALDQALLLRCLNNNNTWYLDFYDGGVELYQVQAGGYTLRASAAKAKAQNTNYLISATLSGNTITATVDGGSQITYASATFQNTQTKFGFNSASLSHSFDDFQVTVP